MNFRMKKELLVLPLILTLALTGCTKKNAETKKTTETTATETTTENTSENTNVVTTTQLSDEAKKAAQPFLVKGSPAVLFFFADWCPACRNFKPIVEATEAKFPGVKVVRLNVDEQKDVTKAFKVTSIPSLFFFDKDGKFVESTTGGLEAEKLEDEFEKINVGEKNPNATVTVPTTSTEEVKQEVKKTEETTTKTQ